MIFSAISDLHITSNSDDASKLFQTFLRRSLDLKVQKIFLLGDIFDLMSGDHSQYYNQYSMFFCSLKEVLSRGVEVVYVEGNHDIHLKTLFQKWLVKNQIPACQMDIRKDPVIFCIDNRRFYISHGDEWEIGNNTYHWYKKFIQSRTLEFISNKIFPYGLLESIGRRASGNSRKKNKFWVDNPELVRNRTRMGVEILSKKVNANIIIGGHSHIKDYYVKDSYIYINNGYSPQTRCGVLYDQEGLRHLIL